MYEPRKGRPVRITREVFGEKQTSEVPTDRITGIRVRGISDVQPAKNGELYRTITFGRRTRPCYATAFGEEALKQIENVKEGDILNLETVPTTKVFYAENPETKQKFAVTPLMNKIYRAEKTTVASVDPAL